MEEYKASKPTKKKQKRRLPPKRGLVMISILKGVFVVSSAAKRWEDGVSELSSSSPTAAATPSLYNSERRLPPKRGLVMISILKGLFGISSAAKRREDGVSELSSSSPTPAATPSLYNSDAEFES